MKLYFKDIEISGGGAKLMFGATQVQKLMNNGKLVYQNILPVGTVLWEGEYKVLANKKQKIDLPLVQEDWSNVNANIRITTLINYGVKTQEFTKEDLKKGVPIKIGALFDIIFSRENNKFIIDVQNGSYNWILTKIELV